MAEQIKVFGLKKRDTMPILEAELHDPAPRGSALGTIGGIHNLTGATAAYLHIILSTGTRLIRTMAITAPASLGLVTYQWVATDWDVASGTLVDGAYPVGGLVVGPGALGPNGFYLTPGLVEHRMEYEILGPAGARMTFPNDGGHTLRILSDIGQGT
jgi:hypothetical protein